MTQIKMFGDHNIPDLEQQVNDWLKENKKLNVTHYLQTQSIDPEVDGSIRFTMTVVYSVPSNVKVHSM